MICETSALPGCGCCVLRLWIYCFRSSNWQLHVKMGQAMLHLLAEAGHNNGAKSQYLYLHNMHNLQEIHPGVYMHFGDCYHVIRRGDRYWVGLSADMIIEQVFMRSLITTGGRTRGSGVTESQHLICFQQQPVLR